MNTPEKDPRRFRLVISITVFILFTMLIVAILLLIGVLPHKNDPTEDTSSASTTGAPVTEVTEKPEASETPKTEEPEKEVRVEKSIIENMAPATEVKGVTVTDEMLEKGILNEGNKTRLMNVMERAARGEAITIAYIGGSITAGSLANPQETGCFAALTTKWWSDTFPKAKINYVNAGIGATDSWVGAHRAADDVNSKKPDLVVCEFAVNDGQGWNQETYDSLLRTLLTGPSEPAVVALMIAHKYGSFTDKHAPVAFKYELPIITYSTLLTQKLVSWEKVGNADGTHPDNPGHQLIAHLLTSYYRKVLSEINDTKPGEYKVPKLSGSLTRCRYTNADILYSDELTADSSIGFEAGPVYKILNHDQGWKTQTGGFLTFTVEAREIGVIWLQRNSDPNGKYATYELFIDGESKGLLPGVAESWGTHLEYKTEMLGDEPATHTIELRQAEGTTGSEFEILGIGVSR